MIDLIKFFQILFLSPRISRERLRTFAESHINRLTANNPGGIFNAILAAITSAYTSFAGNLVDISVRDTALKSLNQAMNDAQRAVLEKIRELEPYIKYTYRNDLPTYLLFYPSGLEEYNQATQAQFETISKRFQETLSDHSADFPAAEVTLFNNRMTAYTTALTNEGAAVGAQAGERGEVLDTRQALGAQLTKNLLTIALQYSGQETKADIYFDQSILDAAFTSNSSAEGELDSGETENCFSNTKKPDTQYKVKLNSEGRVRIAFKANEEDDVTDADGAEIVSGEDWKVFAASDLGYSSELKYLNMTNTGEVTTSFIIERM